MKPASEKSDVSPAKSTAEELAFLRKAFRDAVESYAKGIEGQIAHLREVVLAEAKGKKLSARRLKDLRDMTTLMRTLEIKPEKGRRRDLKKVDLLVEELQRLIENW